MREATKGHPARWLSVPSNVNSVQVCLRSGLLPTNGCREATLGPDGEFVEHVGFEFFKDGTEPHEFCTLHGGRGFFERFGIRKAACAIFGCGP
jgi:hypothetical protein